MTTTTPDTTKSLMYEVVWVMDLLATSPARAAAQALELIRGKQTIFIVKSKGGVEEVFDASYDPPRKIF